MNNTTNNSIMTTPEPASKKTVGAWLIHHYNKLHEVTNVSEFDEIEMAGKCGVFLSNLAASDQESDLNSEKVKTIASISGVKRLEIEPIKDILKQHNLIDTSSDRSVVVLGVTTSSVLSHATDIFFESQPSNFQVASISLCESASEFPQEEKILKEFISDSYKLSIEVVNDLFLQSEAIGFIDHENDKNQGKIYFNGNLFKKDNVLTVNTVMSTLTSDDATKVLGVDDILNKTGFIIKEDASRILGVNLLNKLQSIGLYEFNEVSNDQENKVFITKPAAFAKFGNPFEEDALDLAKAFVASLAYGMIISSYGRGKIMAIKVLLQRLINGYEVGPATAIGQDYRLLELRRVIQLRKADSSRFYMKLLKKDVAKLALQVIEKGDVTEQSLLKLTSANVIGFKGPEANRMITRKGQNSDSKRQLANMLRTFRS